MMLVPSESNATQSPQTAAPDRVNSLDVVNAVPMPQVAVIANTLAATGTADSSLDKDIKSPHSPTVASTEDEAGSQLRIIRSGSSVQRLQLMGFGPVDVIENALIAADGDLSLAAVALVEEVKAEPKIVWDEQWDSILVELQEMGFEDRAANKRIVSATNGNLKTAVQKLVQEEREKANATLCK